MPDAAKDATPHEAVSRETYYTVKEIAELWKLSDNAVKKLFFDEPGVLKFGSASRLMGGRQKKYKRQWFMLRIPESVFERVRDRLIHKRPAETVLAGPALGRRAANHLHAS
jgi:hypothetical protein